MSFRAASDVDRPKSYGEYVADTMTGGGNTAVARWKHVPDGGAAFDDAAAFGAVRRALLGQQNNDPRRLRGVAVEIAAMLPAATAVRRRPSDDADDVLGPLWRLFVSLAQQTPPGNLAMLDLVVILDHLSSSPKTAATVTVVSF
ncbi:hypothetical protein LZ31DRAFT_617077, partial [Colletotrichum somersetense]